MKRSVFSFVALAFLSSPAFAQRSPLQEPVACVNADESPSLVLTGTLRVSHFHDANGNLLSSHLLILDQPFCFTTTGIDMPGNSVQASQIWYVQLTGNTTGLQDGQWARLGGEFTTDNVTAYYQTPNVLRIE